MQYKGSGIMPIPVSVNSLMSSVTAVRYIALVL